MLVSDNGIGAQNVVKGIGLAGMEERLAMVGGTLEISSPEDGGFRLRVEIPLVEMQTILPESLMQAVKGEAL
jgi:signal transduction histidine kinase